MKKPPPSGGGLDWSRLLLLADALERGAIGLHVHEAARVGVAFDELLRARIEGLRAFADHPVAVPVSFRWIGCHGACVAFLLNEGSTSKRKCLTIPTASVVQRFVTPVNNPPGAPLNRRPFDQMVGKCGVLPDSAFLGRHLYRIGDLVNTVNQPAGNRVSSKDPKSRFSESDEVRASP